MDEHSKKPKLIYKYVRINCDTKNALKESYLWFSSPKSLNDPFDLKWQFTDRWRKELLDSFKFSSESYSEIFNKMKNDDQFIEYFQQHIVDNIGITVCCFTEKDDDILMWSHYACNHTGVCLMYNLENMPNLFERLRKVKYSPDYPVADNMEKEVSERCISTKSLHWGYEQEWRLLAQEGGKYLIKKESLKGIIFGCRTSAEHINELIKICSDAGYTNLEFYRMHENRREYKLDKKRLLIMKHPH